MQSREKHSSKATKKIALYSKIKENIKAAVYRRDWDNMKRRVRRWFSCKWLEKDYREEKALVSSKGIEIELPDIRDSSTLNIKKVDLSFMQILNIRFRREQVNGIVLLVVMILSTVGGLPGWDKNWLTKIWVTSLIAWYIAVGMLYLSSYNIEICGTILICSLVSRG